jgi:hypothetical protein
MADEKETFARRWSRLKHQSNEPAPKTDETPRPALPPVEKLTAESDFSQFMHPKVEDALRRVALKKLFSDPHFNIADPFEAYSGDFTGGEPIPEAMLASLEQMKQLLRTPAEKKPEELGNEEAKQQAEEQGPKPDEPGRQDT